MRKWNFDIKQKSRTWKMRSKKGCKLQSVYLKKEVRSVNWTLEREVWIEVGKRCMSWAKKGKHYMKKKRGSMECTRKGKCGLNEIKEKCCLK